MEPIKLKSLGLDVSQSSTGWAVLVDGVPVDVGYIGFKGKDPLSRNLYLFSDCLAQVIDKHGPIDYIILEDVFFGKNIKTLKLLSRYSGAAILTARKNAPEAQLILVSPATPRSAMWPGRKMEKADIHKLMVAKFSLGPVPNDITDALILASYPFTLKFALVDPSWII